MATPIKPPLGTQLSAQPSATEAERAASLGSAQQRDRNAKPGGGETGQKMLSDEGGVGVLPTIPATYGAIPEEEKGIREKERGMKRTQEQLLGPAPEAERAAGEKIPEEEEKGRREAARAGVLTGRVIAAQRAEEEGERLVAAGAAAGAMQPSGSPADKMAQQAIRSGKWLLLLSFFGIPIYGLVGTLQTLHKWVGSPLGKKFDCALWEDAIAFFIDLAIALLVFGILYGFVAIIGAISSVPGVSTLYNVYHAVSNAVQ